MGEAGEKLYRYEEIALHLRERIQRGEYPTGRLPSERALSQAFSVQRETVRHALDILLKQGYLIRDTTRGTVIAPSYLAGRYATQPPLVVGGRRTGGVVLSVRTYEDMTAPAAVFRGLARRLGEEGIPVFWYDTAEKALPDATEMQVPSLEYLEEQSVAGVILWPRMPAPLAELRRLRDHLPLILIDRRVPGFESDFVGFQDIAGGRQVTEHLLRAGHRRIGFVSGEPQVSAVQARLAGYRAALEAAGSGMDPALVLHQEGGSRLLLPAAVEAFLQGSGDPVTAVVCANDIIAARLIHFVRGFGRRVPEDVAVTGFGDLMPAMLDAMGITTVAQHFEEMGYVAGSLVIQRLQQRSSGGGRATAYQEVELPMELVVRESCGTT